MGGANESSGRVLVRATIGDVRNGRGHCGYNQWEEIMGQAGGTNAWGRGIPPMGGEWAEPGGCHSPRLEQHGRPLGLQVVPPAQLQLGLLGLQGLQLPQQSQAAQLRLGGRTEGGSMGWGYGATLWGELMGWGYGVSLWGELIGWAYGVSSWGGVMG